MLELDGDGDDGAESAEIEALPEVRLNETIEEYECPVCMEKMSTNDIVRTLPCFHRLRRDCIDKWLSTKKHVQFVKLQSSITNTTHKLHVVKLIFA